MARYIYEWKSTQHGNRLFRRPSAASKASKAAEYAVLKKDELVALAEDGDLDSSGTKADIIARLEADDEQA